MLKQNKDLIWTALVIALFGLLIFGLNRLNQPEEVSLELPKGSEKSDESILLDQALNDPDALFVEEEDSVVLPIANNAQEMTIAAQEVEKKVADPRTEEVATASPILSPVLRQSLKNSEVYASEDYLDPNSSLNQATIQALHEMRNARLSGQK